MTQTAIALYALLLTVKAFVLVPQSVLFNDSISETSKTVAISLPQQPTGNVFVQFTAADGVIVEPCQIRFNSTSWQNQSITVTSNFRFNAPISGEKFMNSSVDAVVLFSDDTRFRNLTATIPVVRQLLQAQVCLSSGDPHYISLDGRKFDVHGNGPYDFHKSPELVVQQRNYECARRQEKPIACTDGVAIQYKNRKQVFSFAEYTASNVSQLQAIPGTSFITPPTNTSVRIAFDNGVVLSFQLFLWGGNRSRPYINIQLNVPGKFAGLSQGLCGNYNNKAADDQNGNFSAASCNLFDQQTAQCPYATQNLLNQPTCQQLFTATTSTVRTTTTAVPTITSTSNAALTTTLKTTTTTASQSATPQPFVANSISSSQSSTIATRTASAAVTTQTLEATTSKLETTTQTVLATPTTPPSNPPEEAGKNDDEEPKGLPFNKDCPEITFEIALSFCGKVLKTLPASYDRNSYHLHSCAFDAVMSCDATATAQDTFVSFQIQIFIQAFILVQSPQKDKCDEGKQLVNSYLPQVILQPKPSGGYTIAKDSRITQSCKSGYGGMGCKQNLNEILGKVLESFSAGERLHASVFLAALAAVLVYV